MSGATGVDGAGVFAGVRVDLQHPSRSGRLHDCVRAPRGEVHWEVGMDNVLVSGTPGGATCEEVEVALNMKHQSASARICDLLELGWIKAVGCILVLDRADEELFHLGRSAPGR